MTETIDTSDEACAVVCMIVSDPSGARHQKPGWKKSVNDLIRALRDERNSLTAQLQNSEARVAVLSDRLRPFANIEFQSRGRCFSGEHLSVALGVMNGSISQERVYDKLTIADFSRAKSALSTLPASASAILEVVSFVADAGAVFEAVLPSSNSPRGDRDMELMASRAKKLLAALRSPPVKEKETDQ